jgi:hypothetical protein
MSEVQGAVNDLLREDPDLKTHTTIRARVHELLEREHHVS